GSLARGRDQLHAHEWGRAMFDPPDRLKVAIIQPYYIDMEVGVQYVAKKKNHKSVCLLYQDDEYGLEHVRGTEAAAKALGIPVGERTTYKRGATDFSSQVARLSGAG